MSAESSPNMFLQNNFAPWGTEGAARDLPVVGRIPRELNGTYYRNGPNPAFPPLGRYHWFDGDGMIHAVTLDDGRASYRNRYVLSRGLREEQEAGRALYRGLLEFQATEIPGFKNTGNTNIVWHAGKLLALVEAALPTRMMAGPLDTVGEYDFDGRLAGPMTAHPKLDPETGEMLFFGYSPFPPYLTYHVAAADGALVRSEVIDVARYGRLDFMSAAAVEEPGYRDANAARLHRWRIDLARGGVASTPLDDIVTEFPRVDERRLGRRHRFGYMAAREPELNDGGQPLWTAVRKYDLARGAVTERRFGAGNGVGEPLFVPRSSAAAEDDGWVLVLVYDAARDTSDFCILDAQDIGREPVARVRLPHRVPYGFHGNWVPA